MTTSRKIDLARALSERVAQRVAGRGISRRVIDDAARKVAEKLPESVDGGAPEVKAELVATISARSIPDLASRVRRILDADHVSIIDMGVGQAGQHTVVTLHLAGQARPAVERLAERLGYFVSFLNPADVRSA